MDFVKWFGLGEVLGDDRRNTDEIDSEERFKVIKSKNMFKCGATRNVQMLTIGKLIK